MANNTLRNIEAINGRQEFDKPLVDNRCPFDDIEKGLEELNLVETIKNDFVFN